MIPWFCVVTHPVKEGFGAPHFENSTGIEPWTSIAFAVRSALSGKVTDRVWPCSVRWPVAL